MNKLNTAIKYRKSKDYEKAEFLFLELLKNEAMNPLVHYHYAWLLDLLAKEKEAIPHYKKALKLGLEDEYRIDCYLGLGSSYRLEKKFKKSMKTFNKALLEFPNHTALEVFKTMTLYEQKKSKKAYFMLLDTMLKQNKSEEIETYKNAISHFIRK